MGICWSGEPEPRPRQVPVQYAVPTAPPAQYNPNYTYAVKPEQTMYYQAPQQYPQQYAQQYPQQYPQQYAQQYPQQYQVYQPQRQTMSPGTAFVGGLVLGAVVEDILDPMD